MGLHPGYPIVSIERNVVWTDPATRLVRAAPSPISRQSEQRHSAALRQPTTTFLEPQSMSTPKTGFIGLGAMG